MSSRTKFNKNYQKVGQDQRLKGPKTPANDKVSDFDSEDKLPLSTFMYQWTNNAVHVNIQHAFEQNYGHNIPEDVESPTDIFLYLLT